MFDSHCHLDAEEYDSDRGEVLARAWAAGVTGVMVPGYEPAEWARLPGLCAAEPRLVCAVGLHPGYVHALSADARAHALSELERWLQRTGALAIGEAGLDALAAKRGGADLETQGEVLNVQLELARALSLPLILHCVHAHGRMLELLERHGPLPRGGVMHAYSGPPDLLARYCRLNLRFSFAGIITHENAKKPRAALAAAPAELLLLETDGPGQVPAGSQRRRSEPADLAQVIAAAAALRGEDPERLAERTAHNARELFGCDRAHLSRRPGPSCPDAGTRP